MTTVDAQRPLIQLENVSKNYGPNTVLDDVSLTIAAGEVVGLLGDNGAGKSTLVKIMSGVVPMSSGRFLWDGEELTKVSRPETERLGIETIFQDSALVPTMSITRNIFAGRELTNRWGFMDLKAMDNITTEILDTVVSIEGIKSAKQMVGSLSGGQAQAVAIARAVHFKRSVLILDEPTSALAVRATEALLSYLLALKGEGISSVLVTHNLHHAFKVCDRHIVLNHGRTILNIRREDTSVEELTAAVVEGAEGVRRHRLGLNLA
jgi:simple sugar transport system ATP-binding protein